MKKSILKCAVMLLLVVSLVFCSGFTLATGGNRGTGSTYSTIVMQGNTNSASDCRVFKDRLLASGRGYTIFGLRGWNKGSDTPSTQIVTGTQFVKIEDYDVAYYSGHGGKSNGHPVINYGSQKQIDVAEVLGVSSSSWQTTSVITPSDDLRVLILATCSQLDTSVVQYYARIMKASKIRAIAGYHASAPSSGDDTIAGNFVNKAKEGNSIWYSWQNSNTGKNWAVLVYQENNNQYYRLPGFPGSTYSEPSSNASVYRYASFLNTPGVVPVNSTSSAVNEITSLPLVITTTNTQTQSTDRGMNREVVVDNISVADDDTVVRNYLATNLSAKNISDKICVQNYVACEEVDLDEGILPDSRVIVERTYNYYDTYSGIKIADSYIGASVDSMGVNNIVDERKCVTSVGASISELRDSAANATYISEKNAIKKVQSEDECCKNAEVLNVSLAYVPAEDDLHHLCYEIYTEHGFSYVSVQTGEIMDLP